jgi:hypothetical protein
MAIVVRGGLRGLAFQHGRQKNQWDGRLRVIGVDVPVEPPLQRLAMRRALPCTAVMSMITLMLRRRRGRPRRSGRVRTAIC